MFEDKINSKFKKAKFKLFKELINGGIEETCETTFGGVPFSDLNSAMRINIGLDIINTLTDHYGINAPIFIDNRETVVELEPSKSQIISLIVSGEDKVLRFEKEGEKNG